MSSSTTEVPPRPEACLSATSVALRLTLGLCVAITLGFAAAFADAWTLMDDAQNLAWARDVETHGFVDTWVRFMRAELSLGVARATYLPAIWLLYGATGASARAATLFNAGLVLAIHGWLLWELIKATRRTRPALEDVVLGLVLCFAVFQWHDQFWFVSLQEKWVAAAMAATLRLMTSTRGQGLPAAAWVLLWAAVATLGSTTKGQYLALLPACAAWQAVTDAESGRSPVRALGMLAVAAITWGWNGWLAMSGTYLRNFDAGLDAVLNPWAWLLLVAGAASLVLAWRHRETESLVSMLPAGIILAFVVLMFRRGIGGYIFGFVAPVLAVMAIQGARWVPSAGRRLVPLACAAALGITAWREPRQFLRSHDLWRVVHSEDAGRLVASRTPIYTPCLEGTGQLRSQLTARWSTPANVILGLGDSGKAGHDGGAVWFGDARNCRLSDGLSADEQGRLRALVAPTFEGSFGLFTLAPPP